MEPIISPTTTQDDLWFFTVDGVKSMSFTSQARAEQARKAAFDSFGLPYVEPGTPEARVPEPEASVLSVLKHPDGSFRYLTASGISSAYTTEAEAEAAYSAYVAGRGRGRRSIRSAAGAPVAKARTRTLPPYVYRTPTGVYRLQARFVGPDGVAKTHHSSCGYTTPEAAAEAVPAFLKKISHPSCNAVEGVRQSRDAFGYTYQAVVAHEGRQLRGVVRNKVEDAIADRDMMLKHPEYVHLSKAKLHSRLWKHGGA